MNFTVLVMFPKEEVRKGSLEVWDCGLKFESEVFMAGN